MKIGVVGISAGIKEIAKALGTSIGTVDRALHSRPGVSPQTCAKVLTMAEKLKYRPNVTARNLKLNRHLRIAVHLPVQIESFLDPVRAGVRAAAEAAPGTTIDLYFRSYPRVGQGEVELLETDVSGHYDGIIVMPGNTSKINALPAPVYTGKVSSRNSCPLSSRWCAASLLHQVGTLYCPAQQSREPLIKSRSRVVVA
jgi:DNA-binding LacI/PurR family transcriptional regulator